MRSLRPSISSSECDEVSVVDYGGVLALVPTFADPVSAGMGLLKGKGRLTDALLEERRADRLREERKARRWEETGGPHEDD